MVGLLFWWNSWVGKSALYSIKKRGIISEGEWPSGLNTQTQAADWGLPNFLTSNMFHTCLPNCLWTVRRPPLYYKEGIILQRGG